MRADTELQQDVIEELQYEPSLENAEVAVSVRDGVATLAGYVDSFAQKYAAERAAERVTGVRVIVESLHVRLPSASTRADPDVAHAVLNALRWDVEVPHELIRAKVENGWVTLEGTVEWQFQRAAAERAVRYLTGVKGVTNLIGVKPSVTAAGVRAKIEEALRRSAELDAKNIVVETHETTVVLSGTVRSWSEKQDAERAAWAAPGVTAVEDRLTLTA